MLTASTTELQRTFIMKRFHTCQQRDIKTQQTKHNHSTILRSQFSINEFPHMLHHIQKVTSSIPKGLSLRGYCRRGSHLDSRRDKHENQADQRQERLKLFYQHDSQKCRLFSIHPQPFRVSLLVRQAISKTVRRAKSCYDADGKDESVKCILYEA